jgi:hypothetical protein
MPLGAGERFLVYGLAGWATDSAFVWLRTGRRRPSSLLNVPVYGLAQPLFEPLHDRLRHRPLALRAAAYGVGILGVEYASGRLLRRVLGQAPWDYGDARLAIDGLVRVDYLPLWAAFGLGLERLDYALRATRPRRRRPGPLRADRRRTRTRGPSSHRRGPGTGTVRSGR